MNEIDVKSGIHDKTLTNKAMNYLPTKEEFSLLLQSDSPIKAQANMTNYSVYHKYNRGS